MKMTNKERKLIEKGRLSYTRLKERQATPPGRKSRLSDWEKARQTLNTSEARRRVVDRAHSGEFWTILFSQASAPFFLQLVAKHYSNPMTDEDATACVVTCNALQERGIEFLVGSFRRRRMLAPVLTREFSKQFDTSYTEREMVASLAILAVEPEMFAHAVHAGEHLFSESEMEAR